jgi:hypothetical protein
MKFVARPLPQQLLPEIQQPRIAPTSSDPVREWCHGNGVTQTREWCQTFNYDKGMVSGVGNGVRHLIGVGNGVMSGMVSDI